MEKITKKYWQFNLNYIVLPVFSALCLLPFIPSWGAILLGIATGLGVENPYRNSVKKITSHLLAFSVMGLGAGMDARVVAKVGISGAGYTALSILLTFLLGALIGKWCKVEKDISLLVTTGTAICGGSAIAAVGPVIHARERDMSVALITVFSLNALGLVLFPVIGHFFGLNEVQFGLWSALAIHDTSSVVGATLQYGKQALEVGTTVKLARALWIIPLTAIVAFYYKSESVNLINVLKRMWFIVGFIALMVLITAVPSLAPVGHTIELCARRLLVVTLFLIGTNLNRQSLQGLSIRPFVQAVILWVMVSILALMAIMLQLIESV